ncbi:hypothetical protein AB0L20_15970 [Streptomyces albidoflavus]|uniref:hypothetical protein n=1 Tax=Streptomyces albidoflavus TaxID=1886 RepID=UPI00344AB535
MMDEPLERPVVVDGKIASLPFHELRSWSQFEKLVCELVQTVEHLSPCHRYGVPGQAQGGIDIAGRSEDGQWHAFQVKLVAQFSPADAKKALDQFVCGTRPYSASRLVVVVSCRDIRTQVREKVRQCQAQHPDLMLELWGAELLEFHLRLHPRIVARYFGDHVARRFCDADALETFYKAGGGIEVGSPVRDADPVGLEVHEAISADDDDDPVGTVLPAYFRRPFDGMLDTAVDQVLGGSSEMRVLLGDSSTGKTRAAWEAVQRLGDEWRLWHPADQEELLASLGAVRPRTVVWLNEINRYLLCGDSRGDEHTAARLRELLRDSRRAPVLILGTAWHVHWEAMTKVSGGGERIPEPCWTGALSPSRRDSPMRRQRLCSTRPGRPTLECSRPPARRRGVTSSSSWRVDRRSGSATRTDQRLLRPSCTPRWTPGGSGTVWTFPDGSFRPRPPATSPCCSGILPNLTGFLVPWNTCQPRAVGSAVLWRPFLAFP